MMADKFYGQTYLYPTPNDGEREIGVIHAGHESFVGWYADDGRSERVLSTNLPISTSPRGLQNRLTAWAKKCGLKATPCAALRDVAGDTNAGGGTPAPAEGSGEAGNTPASAAARAATDPHVSGRPPEAGIVPALVAPRGAGDPGNAAGHCDAETKARVSGARVTALQRSDCSLPVLAANLDAVRRVLELQVPETEADLATLIREQARGERECGLRAAVCAAFVRMRMFPDRKQYDDYIAWMAANAGVKWRMAVTYQNAGMLLMSAQFADLTKDQKNRLLQCTPSKLEIIATSAGDRLAVIAAIPDLDDLPVHKLRAAVTEALLSDKDRKLLAAARGEREKQQEYRESPAGRTGAAIGEIVKLQGLIDADAVADPLAALRAGFVLHKAALDRIEAKREVPLLDLAKVVESMEAALAFAKQLLGG